MRRFARVLGLAVAAVFLAAGLESAASVHPTRRPGQNPAPLTVSCTIDPPSSDGSVPRGDVACTQS